MFLSSAHICQKKDFHSAHEYLKYLIFGWKFSPLSFYLGLISLTLPTSGCGYIDGDYDYGSLLVHFWGTSFFHLRRLKYKLYLALCLMIMMVMMNMRMAMKMMMFFSPAVVSVRWWIPGGRGVPRNGTE